MLKLTNIKKSTIVEKDLRAQNIKIYIKIIVFEC